MTAETRPAISEYVPNSHNSFSSRQKSREGDGHESGDLIKQITPVLINLHHPSCVLPLPGVDLLMLKGRTDERSKNRGKRR